MKRHLLYLLAALFLELFICAPVLGQSPLESGKLIPVYPGAKLDTKVEPGESKSCCNFISGENFDKVIGFYENSLSLKALDGPGLATKAPFLRGQVDELQKQMPQGMKIRFFLLKLVEFQGQQGAELFEVYTTQNGVNFSIMESQLPTADKHFADEWRNVETGQDNPKHVDPQLLIPALPLSVPAGFEKGELNIDSQQNNPTSINISYTKLIKKGTGGENGQNDITNSVNISIYDVTGRPDFYEDMIKPQADGEKSVMVKGKYKGKELSEKNENSCRSEKVFLVNNRFLVEIMADVCDINILNQVIDKMNLDSLPK
jgi:hypothetical protein